MRKPTMIEAWDKISADNKVSLVLLLSRHQRYSTLTVPGLALVTIENVQAELQTLFKNKNYWNFYGQRTWINADGVNLKMDTETAWRLSQRLSDVEARYGFTETREDNDRRVG